jgi:hypothetical protein
VPKGHPRDPKATDGSPNRYPIALQLRYRAKSKLGPVQGLGHTITISNQDIVFAAGDKLKPTMNVEIVLDWPCLRDPRIPVQLVLAVTIASIEESVVEARIVTYAFRTAEQTEPVPEN